MAENRDLATSYAVFKQGTLWSSTGKCKGFAVANPGEAARIDSYVAGLVAGSNPTPPVLATATGRGLVGMLDSLIVTAPVVPPPGTLPPVIPPTVPGWPESFYTGPLGANNLLPPVGQGFLASMFGGIGFSKMQAREQTAQRQAAGVRYAILQTHYDGSVAQTWAADQYGPAVTGMESPFLQSPTQEAWTAANGAAMAVVWTPGRTIAQANSGDNDAVWKKAATYWGSLPHRVMLRAFHEFDLPSNVYGYGGASGKYTADEFKSAWRRMVEIIHPIAPNVGFWWCPFEGGSFGVGGQTSRNMLTAYYPGETYVDWVGSDGYNFEVVGSTGYSTPLHAGWAEFWEVFNYGRASSSLWSCYDIFSGAAVPGQRGYQPFGGVKPAAKPFVIGETGTVPGAPKTAWYQNVVSAANGLRAMANCVGVSFFDCDVHTVDWDWKVDYAGGTHGVSDPGTLAGFVAMAKDGWWA